MLGTRVPAVVVSPLVPQGTVDTQVHDHASVPATLRALFAPDAKPLSARDAWSPPFHAVASLDQPRTDLPDLSAHTAPRPDVASVAAAITTTPAEVTTTMPLYAESSATKRSSCWNTWRKLENLRLSTPSRRVASRVRRRSPRPSRQLLSGTDSDALRFAGRAGPGSADDSR